jgi:hypothetical protein
MARNSASAVKVLCATGLAIARGAGGLQVVNRDVVLHRQRSQPFNTLVDIERRPVGQRASLRSKSTGKASGTLNIAADTSAAGGLAEGQGIS